MTIIESRVCDIPLSELQTAEECMLGVLHMDRETMLNRFEEEYERTNTRCADSFVCRGMYKSFPIASVTDTGVELEGGPTFESPFLASMLQRAEELVLYAVTVHGYEDLARDPDNDMIDSMFYDAWGAGYSMSAHHWLKASIGDQAQAAGMYAGRGWTPGEDNLEMSLQKDLFKLLDPSQIGITLEGGMHPVMSVSGFMGISSDPAIEQDGASVGDCH